MHADGLCHCPQVQGSKVGNSEGEETILLTNNLGGDFQYGPRPLVQALQEPVRLGKAVRDKDLLGVGPGAGGHPGEIAAVDQQPRQGIAVQLHVPQAARPLPDDDVRSDGCRRLTAERGPGPGRQSPDLRDHLAKVLVIDAADTPQSRHVAPGKKVQVIHERRHGRVKPVPLDQLQPEAFGDIPGEDSRGLETLQDAQDRFEEGRVTTQALGGLDEIAPQVPALIHRVDQDPGCRKTGAVEAADGELGEQVVAQGRGPRQALGEIAVGLKAATAGAAPVNGPARVLASGHVAGRPLPGGGLGLMADVEPGFGPRFGNPIGGEGRLRARIGRHGLNIGIAVLARQEGVPLELGLDKGVELEAGQLQKLDGLLQLGRDDQPLSLTNL